MDIALRAIFLYAFVVLLMRVMGRRELSSLSPLDLVLLIVLGDAIQQGLTQDDYSVTGAVIAVPRRSPRFRSASRTSASARGARDGCWRASRSSSSRTAS